MVRNISEDLRWRIVYLHCDGLSHRRIFRYLYVSRATVSRVLRLFKRWGSVRNSFDGMRERKRILDNNDMGVSQKVICICTVLKLTFSRFYRRWLLRKLIGILMNYYPRWK